MFRTVTYKGVNRMCAKQSKVGSWLDWANHCNRTRRIGILGIPGTSIQIGEIL